MPAQATYDNLATVTLGGSAATYTFSNIPQGFTDLVLVMTIGTTASTASVFFRVNGDSGSNYSWTRLSTNGSSATSSRGSNTTSGAISQIALSSTSFDSVNIAHFMNYSNTTRNKTVITRSSNPNQGTELITSMWRSNSAITSIDIGVSTGSLAANSRLTLYGIATA